MLNVCICVSVCPADVQQLMVNKGEVPPEQQQWSPLVDQEDPETPHIKEEQEEPWTNQEGEEPQHLEQPDIKFTLTAVTVKSEEDEEKPELSQLHQDQTEENRTDCGDQEPAGNSGPDGHLQQGTEDKTDDSEDDWMQNREPQSGLNTKNNTEPLSGMKVLVHHGFAAVIIFNLQSLQRNMLFGLRLKNSHTFDDLGLFFFFA